MQSQPTDQNQVKANTPKKVEREDSTLSLLAKKGEDKQVTQKSNQLPEEKLLRQTHQQRKQKAEQQIQQKKDLTSNQTQEQPKKQQEVDQPDQKQSQEKEIQQNQKPTLKESEEVKRQQSQRNESSDVLAANKNTQEEPLKEDQKQYLDKKPQEKPLEEKRQQSSNEKAQEEPNKEKQQQNIEKKVQGESIKEKKEQFEDNVMKEKQEQSEKKEVQTVKETQVRGVRQQLRLTSKESIDEKKHVQWKLKQIEPVDPESVQKINPHNPALQKQMRILMSLLIKEFQDRTYRVNLALVTAREQFAESESHYKQEDLNQLKRMEKQIELFVWQLVIAPKHWILMMKNQQIHAQEQEFIDLKSFTARIFKRINHHGLRMTPYFSQLAETVVEQIYIFLEHISVIICEHYNKGRKKLTEEMDQINTELSSGCSILNVYTLYKILRDVSIFCRMQIAEQAQLDIFRHIETEISDKFAHYIIEKYEVLGMRMDMNDTKRNKKQIDIAQKIMISKQVSWRQAVNEDGQKGFFVQLKDQSGDEDQEDEKTKKAGYMIKVDEEGQMQVMNCASLTKNWKVMKDAEKNTDILHMIKNKKALAQRMRGTSIVHQPRNLTTIDAFSTVGGSLGRTLADIDKYDNIGDFVTDLSKRAAIGGSLSYMLASAPVISYFFVAGGFSYSFYYIFSNKKNTFKKKFENLSNLTIDTASSVGSGVLGAFVGQALIPFPVVGAFIGGVVGGLIGEIGGRTISNTIEGTRFKHTIAGLRQNIKPKGYWEVDKTTLGLIGINKEHFYNSIPADLQKRVGCDKIWLTLIGFVLLSFHQSKQRSKFMKKKFQELKHQKTILHDHDVVDKEEYQTSLDMMCMTNYLEEERIILIKYVKPLEAIIGDMFTRLK